METIAPFIGLLPFIIIGGIIYLYSKKLKTKVEVPKYLPNEGVDVPVINILYGKLRLNVHNGLYPKFVIFPDRIEARLFSSKTIYFQDIKNVDARVGFWQGGGFLQINFAKESWNYYVNMNRYNLKQVLNFLQTKNIQLSEKAQKILNEN